MFVKMIKNCIFVYFANTVTFSKSSIAIFYHSENTKCLRESKKEIFTKSKDFSRWQSLRAKRSNLYNQ